MRISKTYRFLARLISATLFIGVISPVVLQVSMFVHCETMIEVSEATQASMHDHDSMSNSSMEMNPVMDMNTDEDCCMTSESMDHQSNDDRSSLSHCETTIDCNCDLDDKSVHKEAVILHIFKVPIPTLSSINSFFLEDYSDPSPIPIHYSNSYSPPLLFLANESFLI